MQVLDQDIQMMNIQAQVQNLVAQGEAWEVDMVVKVKEPLPEEYRYFKKIL